jgi:hypothetical protein
LSTSPHLCRRQAEKWHKMRAAAHIGGTARPKPACFGTEMAVPGHAVAAAPGARNLTFTGISCAETDMALTKKGPKSARPPVPPHPPAARVTRIADLDRPRTPAAMDQSWMGQSTCCRCLAERPSASKHDEAPAFACFAALAPISTHNATHNPPRPEGLTSTRQGSLPCVAFSAGRPVRPLFSGAERWPARRDFWRELAATGEGKSRAAASRAFGARNFLPTDRVVHLQFFAPQNLAEAITP